MITCTKCGQEKLPNSFAKGRRQCKECRTQYLTLWFRKRSFAPAQDSEKVYRRCSTCSVDKALSSFGRDKRVTNGYGYRCKQCIRTKGGHEQSHIRLQTQKLWRQEKEKIIARYRSLFACKCGESDSVTMQFHHRDPNTKVFEIGSGRRMGNISAQMLQTEIEKCDVLCANCHLKAHKQSLR